MEPTLSCKAGTQVSPESLPAQKYSGATKTLRPHFCTSHTEHTNYRPNAGSRRARAANPQ
jgi:hypothetical protein